MQIHHYDFNSAINFLLNAKYYTSLRYCFVFHFIETLSNCYKFFKERKGIMWAVPETELVQFTITQFWSHEVDEQMTRNIVYFSTIYSHQPSVTGMLSAEPHKVH